MSEPEPEPVLHFMTIGMDLSEDPEDMVPVEARICPHGNMWSINGRACGDGCGLHAPYTLRMVMLHKAGQLREVPDE